MATLGITLSPYSRRPNLVPSASSNANPFCIDLAWTCSNRPSPSVEVLQGADKSFASDHTALSFSVSMKLTPAFSPLTLPVDSDEEKQFLSQLSRLILVLPSLDSHASCELLQKEVMELFEFIETTKCKSFTPHSIAWWNEKYSPTVAAMRLGTRSTTLLQLQISCTVYTQCIIPIVHLQLSIQPQSMGAPLICYDAQVRLLQHVVQARILVQIE